MNSKLSLKPPKYYRQRFLLALLEEFGGVLSKTELQKYTFLFEKEFHQDKPFFDFVPYKFGPFSFQIYADLRRLEDLGHIQESQSIRRLGVVSQLQELDPSLREKLARLRNQYGKLKKDKLLEYVYTNYSYYTKRSEIREQVIEQSPPIPRKQSQVVFTIGYEGRSIDAYLNLLIQEDITTLVDVRKNPISMKIGFSKKQLMKYMEQIGLEYIHIPELGIESEDRQRLGTTLNHEELFREYENSLRDKKVELKRLQIISESKKRIALTCFELDPKHCHRSRIASALEKMQNCPTVHL